jgi:predicted PilT family ATPase
LYEIYSFGEQVVVMDLSKIRTWWADGLTPMQWFAAKYIEILVDKYIGVDVKVKLQVDESSKWIVIGKGWEAIMGLEKKLWLKINVKSKDGGDSEDEDEVMSKPKYRPWRTDKRAKRR